MDEKVYNNIDPITKLGLDLGVFAIKVNLSICHVNVSMPALTLLVKLTSCQCISALTLLVKISLWEKVCIFFRASVRSTTPGACQQT